MTANIQSEIQKGLIEKRTHLDQWQETASQAEKDCCFASNEDAGLEAHLTVIDGSLEKIETGSFGVCEVCGESVDDELLQMDYTTTVCLGHYTPEQLRELESELELSQVIQRALLPQNIPTLPGLDLAAFNRPAQIVGGDYFDFLTFKDGAPGFVIADVSGHGVSAGMLVTSLQTAFHTLVPDTHSPLDVLERLNRLYIHNIRFTTFVTIFFGRLDLQSHMLTYVNAGHNPGLLHRHKDGSLQRLVRTNPAIGLVEGFTCQTGQVQLSPGDRLLLYTDGVTEAANSKGDQFGEERLTELLHEFPDQSSRELIQTIRNSVFEFSGGRALADDQTILAVRVL